MFKQNIYEQRRSQLKAQFATGILLFLGNSESPMNYPDNAYPFRQDSNFLYFAGISQPDLAFIIDVDSDTSILFGDELSIDAIVWMGEVQTLADAASQVGIQKVVPRLALKSYLEKAQQAQRAIHYLPPYRAENKQFLSQLFNLPLIQITEKASEALRNAVISQREIKGPEEIAEMHQACDISADMHLAAMKYAKAGMTEREVMGHILGIANQQGSGLAYHAIVTINGQILHNHVYSNQLKAGDMLLNDSGAATTMEYAGDLTRTFPIAAKFTSQQAELYDAVYSAYQAALTALKPGNPYLYVHQAACRSLINSLKEMGLMQGDTEEALKAGAHAMFFQCGTGHMIGLDVHDMEDLGEEFVGFNAEFPKNTEQFGLKSLRFAKPLQIGHTLTVEPGLYFIPQLMDLWEATGEFKNYINYTQLKHFRHAGGIRIEDNFVIQANGYQKLGKDLIITRSDIEQLRSS